MTESPRPEDGSSVVSLESLPDGSLRFDQVESLEEADAVEIAAPIVIEEESGRVTHFNLVIEDTYYYLGWNPEEEQWEQILVAAEAEESMVVESVATYFDDETGDAEFWFDTDSDPTIEDIVDYFWEYVEYTYSDTSELRNIIGEATEDFLDDS